MNIIFRPLAEESSSLWGKQGAIKQKKKKKLSRATERLIVNTEIKLPGSKNTSFVMRPCKNKEIVAASGFVREAAPFL